MSALINSKEYWEKRFSDKDWEKNFGREQTKFFYDLLLEMLPQWVSTDILCNNMSIADLGCAEGQGTAVLASRFGSNVTGVDVAPSAIDTARQLHPNLRFSVSDITANNEKYDVCVISNVLEHFCVPFEIAKQIVQYTNNYLILMIPLEENPLMPEHMVSFNYNNIPIAINGMTLVHFAERDCREIEDTLFLAKQILLVYSSCDKVNESISIESMSGIISMYQKSMEAYKQELTNLCKEANKSTIDFSQFSVITFDLNSKLIFLEKLIDLGGKLQFLPPIGEISSLNNVVQLVRYAYQTLYELYNSEHSFRERVTLELVDTNDKFVELQDSCEKLNADYCQSVSQYNKLNESHLNLASEYNEINESHSNLVSEYNELNESHSNLVSEYNELNESHSNLVLEYNEINEGHLNLSSQYNKLDNEYLQLVVRFNALNDAYGVVVNEHQAILSCRTWRAASKLKAIARRTGLLNLSKYFLAVRRLGFNKGSKMAFNKLTKKSEIFPILLEIPQKSLDNTQDTEALNAINYRMDLYKKTVDGVVTIPGADELCEVLSSIEYKGIIVYPHAVHWEPMQRPQHILREFAKKGYLCIFCEYSLQKEYFVEIEKNLFIISDETIALPFLQDKYPIVLFTFLLQDSFCKFLPQKTIWFDILDRLDFFALNGALSQKVYANMVKTADIVTYSSVTLKEDAKDRADAIYLPNAVNIADFWNSLEAIILDPSIQKIVASGNPIIGYYGAVEEWFDCDAVTYLADHFACEIVIVGHVGIDPTLLHRSNIHLLGKKNYHELQKYSRGFQIGIIPFIVSALTDAVSPVKFFEYCALGIPTISAPIAEMLQFSGDAVKFYHSGTELVELCQRLCDSSQCAKLKQEALKIAKENSWEHRVCTIEKKLLMNITKMQYLANSSHEGMIAVETVTFFKYDGSCYYSGGAERYLIDLHEICKEMGIKLRVYQYGESSWVRLYGDMEVVGMYLGEIDVSLHSLETLTQMSHYFEKLAATKASLSIYSPFYILMDKPRGKAIGISHGISWDDEFNKHDGISLWNANRYRIDAARYCNKMVSVDTNTANWFQTIDYELGRKITYIPNYVDNEEFSPRADFDMLREKVVIAYPRRLYGARGLYVVLDVLDDILEKYPNAEFHFVGKGFENDTKHVEKKVARWRGRIQWYSCPPDEMHTVYKNSDISLIPTMYSEGTSLSCLEALSSGNAVISTRIGGLTDLIINGYNGLLIEPDAESLKDAICCLLDNPQQMIKYKKVAIETAHAFSKKLWREKWKKQICSMLNENEKLCSYVPTKTCYIELRHTELGNDHLVKTVGDLLQHGWFVFIASKFREVSFERLQFLPLNEEIYFVPTLRLSDTDDTLGCFEYKQGNNVCF